MTSPFPSCALLAMVTCLGWTSGSTPGHGEAARLVTPGARLHLAQAPDLPPIGGSSPFLQAPPTVIPQTPSDSRTPNIGAGGGTLGRPSAIPNPLGYDDTLYHRRPRPKAPPPVVLPPPSRQFVDPPASASPPRAVRRKPKADQD